MQDRPVAGAGRVARAAALWLPFALALAACTEPPVPSAEDAARADTLRPRPAELALKYERSCMVCHAHVAANAPLTGHKAAWQPRLEQGMDVLVDHAEQGLRGMPPRGQCADCSRDELRELIVFMAQGQ